MQKRFTFAAIFKEKTLKSKIMNPCAYVINLAVVLQIILVVETMV
jgi:hypothetical protein